VAWQEEQKAKTGRWPDRPLIPPPAPWNSVDRIRAAVIRPVFGEANQGGLVVSHRPVKRKLVGAFHLDTAYGRLRPDDPDCKLFVTRIPINKVNSRRLSLKDEPGKGGIGPVRDRELRNVLREIVRSAGMNPDKLPDKAFGILAKQEMLRMPSGVPIRAVRVVDKLLEPVVFPSPAGPRYDRIYKSGSNHHMEIIEDEKTGEWHGCCISTFEAVQRVRPRKQQKAVPPLQEDEEQTAENLPHFAPPPALVRKDHGAGKRFVMSVAEGETVYSRRQDRPKDTPNYYVVAKLEKNRIHFQPHHDARPEKAQRERKIRWAVSPKDLKKLGPAPDMPPYKVRVGPLGDVERLPND
jgi:hypothetical protein